MVAKNAGNFGCMAPGSGNSGKQWKFSNNVVHNTRTLIPVIVHGGPSTIIWLLKERKKERKKEKIRCDRIDITF